MVLAAKNGHSPIRVPAAKAGACRGAAVHAVAGRSDATVLAFHAEDRKPSRKHPGARILNFRTLVGLLKRGSNFQNWGAALRTGWIQARPPSHLGIAPPLVHAVEQSLQRVQAALPSDPAASGNRNRSP
jgi:hypothetical protein